MTIRMTGHAGGPRGLMALARILALSVATTGAALAADPQAPAAPNAPANPPAATSVPPAKSDQPAAGTPATVVDGQQIESILGKTVDSTKGEDMGRITDILIDKSGQIRAAVVDFGGFFGVGSRKVAIDWTTVRFEAATTTNAVVVDIPADQLRAAPIYKEGEPVVILGARHDEAPKIPPAAAPDTAGAAAKQP